MPGIHKLCYTVVSHGVFDLCVPFCLLYKKKTQNKQMRIYHQQRFLRVGTKQTPNSFVWDCIYVSPLDTFHVDKYDQIKGDLRR